MFFCYFRPIYSYNFYLIVTKLDTQVDLVERKVQFKDGLCGSDRNGNNVLQNLESLIKVIISTRLLLNVVYIQDYTFS